MSAAYRNQNPIRRARAEIARQYQIACEVGPTAAYELARYCWLLLYRMKGEKPLGWAVVDASALYSMENARELASFREVVVPVYESHRIEDEG